MSGHLDRKHVLLADDEPANQQLVARTLRLGDPETRVTCASDGVEALQVLAREPVDLLITALLMPVIDGVELLRHVANRRLALPVLVMGERGMSDEPGGSGAVELLAAPLAVDHLAARARARLEQRSAVNPTTVSLADLARMIAVTRRTCALRVALGEQRGLLHFVGGVLVDARAGERHGDDAARELFSWHHAAVAFSPVRPTRTATIRSPLADLLRVAAPTPAPAPWEGHLARAKLSQVLADAMTIDGALGASIAAWELDHGLGSLGAAAVPGDCRVMRALLTAMTRLGTHAQVQDVLITLDDQLHILTPLPRHADLFLYLAVDRARGNLTLTRHRLGRLVADLAL